MTAQQTTWHQEHAGLWFSYAWHPAAILLFLVVAYVGTGVWALLASVSLDITAPVLLIFIVTIILFFVEAAGAIKAIRGRDLARAAWQASAIALLVASVIFAPQIRWAAQFTNQFLFPSVFEACEHEAQPYAPDAKFASCKAHSMGDGFSIIVYDSGGEISKPEPQHSESFKALLKAQGAGF